MKFKHLLATIATGALAVVTLTVGGASTALADCRTDIDDTYMDTIVVGTSYAKTSTFYVDVTDCGGEDARPFIVDATFYRVHNEERARNIQEDYFDEESSTWGFSGTTRWDPRFMNNSYAGSWTPFVSAWGSTQDEAYTSKFWVQRAARATTNASPEPVKKGRTITVGGTLKRANWDTNTYGAYTNQSVDLEFRTSNGSYDYVKSVRTNSKGNLRTTVTARRDGCYRYVYTGHSTTSDAVSVGDCIDVR